MSNRDFKDVGLRIGATIMGVSNEELDITKAAAATVDVESSDNEIQQLSTDFLRSFCKEAAVISEELKGYTVDVEVLNKLAASEVWCSEFQDMAETYMVELAEALEAPKTEAEEAIKKSANARLSSLIPGVAGKGLSLTPSALKVLLASGIGLGAGAGGLAWGLNRSVNEDSDQELDDLQAKVNEYEKINRILSEVPGPDTDLEKDLESRVDSY